MVVEDSVQDSEYMTAIEEYLFATMENFLDKSVGLILAKLGSQVEKDDINLLGEDLPDNFIIRFLTQVSPWYMEFAITHYMVEAHDIMAHKLPILKAEGITSLDDKESMDHFKQLMYINGIIPLTEKIYKGLARENTELFIQSGRLVLI